MKGDMTMNLSELLQKMWTDYCALNPHAKSIHDLLALEEEKIENDHIALRTFKHPRLGIESMSQIFKKNGYTEKKDYFFKEKKLYAKHYEHSDPTQPKIFISELEIEKLSPFVQRTVHEIVDQIPEKLILSDSFCMSGRSWKMSHQIYSELAKESEYASWVAAFGFRPNHFTVFINNLKKYNDIYALNTHLKSKGYTLNSSGGEVKGSPAEYLVQSSTMAENVLVQFDDGAHEIPACYYEFAKRYALKDGTLYQGFVAASADKIFESTNKLK